MIYIFIYVGGGVCVYVDYLIGHGFNGTQD